MGPTAGGRQGGGRAQRRWRLRISIFFVVSHPHAEFNFLPSNTGTGEKPQVDCREAIAIALQLEGRIGFPKTPSCNVPRDSFRLKMMENDLFIVISLPEVVQYLNM